MLHEDMYDGKTIEGIPEVPKDRIFLFRGEDGYSPKTTTDELVQFIRHCMPPPEHACRIKRFDYRSYLNTIKNSGNYDLLRC